PNPLMMRSALNTVEGHSESTAMIGDRMDTDIVAGMQGGCATRLLLPGGEMDTDIVAGIEAGLDTILVLTGVTGPAEVERYPYRPNRVVASIADLLDEIEDGGPGGREGSG